MHPSLDPHLYDKYIKALGPTPLKDQINKIVKHNLCLDVAESLTKDFTSNLQISSPDYYNKMYSQIFKGLKLIKERGLIPYGYKPLGLSPRILPIGYSSSINSVKRQVRNYAYKLAAEKCRNSGLNIKVADLDLKSCYTSILLGLYPFHLSRMQEVIEGIGLWEYIRFQFIKNGRGEIYNKPGVKICTYSSFFQGGFNAMITGILEDQRKNLGLTPQEFRETPFYEDLHAQAREIAGEMMNSEIIHDFKSVSTRVLEEFKDDYMVGPTGHAYKVTQETLKTCYPNYLQSFEFALLAQSTLNTMQNYQDLQLIGHYHDGNVVVYPLLKEEEVLNSLKENVSHVGRSLGLSYQQNLEIKNTY